MEEDVDHWAVDEETAEGGSPVRAVLAILYGLFIVALALVSIWGLVQRHGCLSNVRQLARAAQMYASDYSGRFPASACWPESLQPYLPGSKSRSDWDRVLNCPYDQRTERQTCNGLATSYTMSQDCGGMDSRLPGRGQVGIFFDGTDVAGGLASMDARHLSRWGRQGPPMLSVGFADGHAESVYYYNFDAIALSPPSAAH